MADVKNVVPTTKKRSLILQYFTKDIYLELMKITMMSDIDNNENAIITASNLSPDDFKILPTSTNPNILNGLWDNYNNYYDVVKELLGINNNEQSDKKERLITDEVNSNNYVTDLFLQFRLKQRQDFCENVNKIFGTNISVELSSTFQAFEETLTSEDNEDNEGVDDDGE